MAITYFRCTNLDKNASSYNLYLKGVAEDILLKTIPVTGTETEVEFNLNEIDALAEPNSYELYAQAISADINEFEHSKPSEILTYKVGDSGDTGDDDSEEEGGGGGSEEDDTNQYYTFTIIPTPDTATVTLTSAGYTQDGNSITVLNESKVQWKVEAEGYVSQSGEWTVTENKEHPVALDTSTFPPVNYTEIEPSIYESKAVYESDDEIFEMTTNNDTNVYEFSGLPAPITPYNADEVGNFQFLLSAPVNGEYYIKKDDSSGNINDEYFFINDLQLSNQNIGDIEYYNIDSEGANIISYFPRILITVPKEVTVRGAYGKEGVL